MAQSHKYGKIGIPEVGQVSPRSSCEIRASWRSRPSRCTACCRLSTAFPSGGTTKGDRTDSAVLMERGQSVFVYEPRTVFQDRREAGKSLADRLVSYDGEGTIVLAIPCGGVPLGLEVATKLGSDLDVIVPRKIGIPGNPEARLRGSCRRRRNSS